MKSIRSSRGFSLVELMVAAVISIIASAVIFQVFSTAERQKRTTTGAADAQTNGAIASYMIERDVKMAGWGLVESSFAVCTSLFSYYDANDGTAAGPVNDLFASVSIADGGANGSDSVTIQYYDNPANQNFKFSVTTLRSTMPQSSSELNVDSVYGCAENSLAIVRQGGQCTLMQITQVQGQALKLQHNPGQGAATYNPPVNYQNANSWPAYTTGATLQCFTQLFKRTYRINANYQLELVDPVPAVAAQLAPEIVAMQAQYGITAGGGSQQVNDWVDATGVWVSPLSTTDIARIKAVRVALVARSAQADKPDTSGNCATTTSTDDWSSWAEFGAVEALPDWQCYRYKVYETVIPLRNIIWSNM